MTQTLILSESDLRSVVQLDLDAVDCIERAFVALATEAVIMPPILRLDIQASNGEVDVKTAYLPGLDSFAIKISPGFFDNPRLGLPSLNGLMVLLSAQTGLLQALLLDNGYLTAVRTAAAGAVAARCLARPDAHRAAILGAGEQARLQLQALMLVRPIRSARVWSSRVESAEGYAREMSRRLGIEVRACASIDDAVAEADVVVTATPSSTPLLQEYHLRPGMHITAMGSDAEHKTEIAAQVIPMVTQYVCDRLQQVRGLGELHHAITAGYIDAAAEFPELGQILAGVRAGRRSGEDITLCDLTGTGVQDTAIAALAHSRAIESARGAVFNT